MAGALYHINAQVTGSNATELTQNTFYWIRKAFDNHPGYTRIASYYGVGGTGLGPNDGSDEGPSQDPRWVVYRKTAGTTTFDLFIGGTAGSFSPQNNPSGSYTIAGNPSRMGFAAAWHPSGEAWNGTILNNGQDSFVSATLWKSGSTILPRSNSRWGYASSSLNDLAPFGELSYLTPSSSIKFIADDDNFAVFGDGGGNPSYPTSNDGNFLFFGGMFQITPASASFDMPYLLSAWGASAFGNLTSLVRGTEFGALSNLYAAGVWVQSPVGEHTFSSSFGYGLDWDAVGTDPIMPLFAPDPITGSGSYALESPILVFGGQPANFYLGYLDFIRVINSRFQSYDTFGSGSRIVIGWGSNAGFASIFTSCSLPWSSSFISPVDISGTFYLSGTSFPTSSLHGWVHNTQSFLYDRFAYTTSSFTVYRSWDGSQYTYSTVSGDVIIGTFFTPVSGS